MLQINNIADVVFCNGKVHTVNEKNDVFSSIAVKENKVLAVGTDEEIKEFVGSDTKIIDLKGKSLIPGINDGHNHIWEAGLMYDGVVVFGISSIDELIETVRKKAETLPEGRWLQGASFIESQFVENRAPNRDDLDKASVKNPIVIERIFGACTVNSLALELA